MNEVLQSTHLRILEGVNCQAFFSKEGFEIICFCHTISFMWSLLLFNFVSLSNCVEEVTAVL